MSDNHAYTNAQSWMETILEYSRALDPETWERLEELEEERQMLRDELDAAENCVRFHHNDAIPADYMGYPEGREWQRCLDAWNEWREDNADELQKLESIRDEYQDEDHAREMAQESVLSLELTGSWTPGEMPTADGFSILLSTGGPALRIVGELNQYQEPDRAWLEYQDWGTPWTEYHGDNADQDALLTFCSCFYFSE